jgi:hypothetical protein
VAHRVWITDGSVPVFSDTRRLRASHRGLFGLPVRYEGFVDPAVPRGSAAIEGDRPDDALFVEAEWYVEFPEGIDRYLADPDSVAESTPLVLQGLIEGKWMNRLLGTRAWQPASLGNNVIAEGPGIATTVGALDGAGAGETRIEYELGGGRSQRHTASLADLRGQNIVDLLRDVLQACRDDGEALDGIDLGAIGDSAAVVNEPKRLKAALRPFPNPLGVLPHRVKERLVRGALADEISVPPGASVMLTTTDERGTAVGEATLTWHRGASARLSESPGG